MKKSILAVAVGAAFGALNWLDRQATDKSRSFTFGANFFSTQVTNQKAAPPVRVRVRELHGRVRYALGLWPATNPAPAIADQLFFVRLPKGVSILGHLSRLSWNAGTAACTMTFGDSASTNRHLVATAINAAGNATPSAIADSTGATDYVTTDETRDGTGVPSATNDCDLLGLVAGAVVAVTQLIAARVAYVQD
jgi:hypothetical protein